MRGDSKSKTQVHARRIILNRRVEKLAHLREGYDLIKIAFDLRQLHAENRPVKKNVFTPAQVRMKTCADFQQAAHAPVDVHLARGWFDNARQDFQKR